MSDKVIGTIMVLGALGTISFLLVWTIIMPLLDHDFIFKAYIALAIVVFLAVAAVMLIVAWIGITLIKTKPAEDILQEIEREEEKEEEKSEEK